MSAGHDAFPGAKVVVFPERELDVFPNVQVQVDESVIVMRQAEENAVADLVIVVSRALDHHGNDVRELVAHRIAEGISQ